MFYYRKADGGGLFDLSLDLSFFVNLYLVQKIREIYLHNINFAMTTFKNIAYILNNLVLLKLYFPKCFNIVYYCWALGKC